MKTRISGVLVESLVATIEAIVPDDPEFERTFRHDPLIPDEAEELTLRFRQFWFAWPRRTDWLRILKPKERHPRDLRKLLDLFVAYPFPVDKREYVAGMADDDALRIAHVLETSWAAWNTPGAPFVVQGLECALDEVENLGDTLLRSHFTVTVYYNRDGSY